MEPNSNPPSERDWTVEEREAFFSSQDAITGLPNSAMAGTPINRAPFHPSPQTHNCGNEMAKEMEWFLPREPGIYITKITPPEQGWPMAFHCPICRKTTFLLSLYSEKPKDGDYFRLNDICPNEVLGFDHNMRLGMKGYNQAIDLKPSSLYWGKNV